MFRRSGFRRQPSDESGPLNVGVTLQEGYIASQLLPSVEAAGMYEAKIIYDTILGKVATREVIGQIEAIPGVCQVERLGFLYPAEA